MGLLYDLEEKFEGTVLEQLGRSLQDALDSYRPRCKDCDASMHRHHTYPRSIMTRHGELQLTMPMFRCPECSATLSGQELIGEEEMRKRYSKKRGRRR